MTPDEIKALKKSYGMDEKTRSLCEKVQKTFFEDARNNWKFTLSGEQIIKHKLPAELVGCTGVCKVFCKYARDAGFDCWVVCAANVQDLSNNLPTIGGHQIIAVNVDGELKGFNPDSKKFLFWTLKIEKGKKFMLNGRERIITAIIPRDDVEKIDSYQKLRDLYVNGEF